MLMKNAILRRKSERSYTGEELKKEDKLNLFSYLENEKNRIGIYKNKIHIYYVKSIGIQEKKISTYGVIKNAPGFLVAVCKNNQQSLLDCGYVFEKLVLFLETLGLGTCWLGGTYKRSQLYIPVGKNEIIPIISPVGYSADKKTFTDKAFRHVAKSNQRLNFDDLFFYKNFNECISSGNYRTLLEYVRLAPSASNKQPWRVIIDKNETAHFYIERSPGYGMGKLPCDLQMIDIGIALSHYAISKNNKVVFIEEDPNIPILSNHCSYIISAKDT